MPLPQVPGFKTLQDVSGYLARLRYSLEADTPIHLERGWALGLTTLSLDPPSVIIPEVVPPPRNFSARSTILGVQLIWDAPLGSGSSPDPSIKAFEVQRATNIGMTTGLTSLGFMDTLQLVDIPSSSSLGTFFYRGRSIRYNGDTSVWTPVVSVVTLGIDGSVIANGSLTTPKYAPLSVTTPKIAANAITVEKIERVTANAVILSQGVGSDAIWTKTPTVETVTTTVSLVIGAAGAGIAIFRWGATSVADGETIAHGLGATPAAVLITPSVAGEMASATAADGTTFTVALKKHDGTGGTTQVVSWMALI